MHNTLKGSGVALVTPFTPSKDVDYPALKRILEHTENHVDYWVIHGTTGESVTLDATEKTKTLDFIREHNPRNLPLVYGLGGCNTQVILDSFKSMNLEGITAILSVTPYYNRPSQAGLLKHYETVADASPLPIILYNVPGRTSTNIEYETTLKLAEHPNIIGIKEASGNMPQIIKIAQKKPSDFLLISGDDLLTLPMISVGCCGVISVLANAIPELFARTVNYALNQDFKSASELLFRWRDLNGMMYLEGSPAGVKHLLQVIGVCDNTVRLPLTEPSAQLQYEIATEYEKVINQ